MSAPLKVSAELAASVQRMRAERPWVEDDALLWEHSLRSTRPAIRAKLPTPGRLSTRFMPRQRPTSPDRRASLERRRRLGGSGVLPANLRPHYTLGQMAVLCILAGEVKHHGVCDLPIDKIAALAGVCRTTVQTTLHEARRLLHIEVIERPRPGRKHLPNEVRIISREWRAWLERGPTAHRPGIGSNSLTWSKKVSTTKNTDLQEERFARVKVMQRGYPRGVCGDASPPGRGRSVRHGSQGKKTIMGVIDDMLADIKGCWENDCGLRGAIRA